MASEDQVKRYLAHWFHLGKKIIVGAHQAEICPQSILEGDHYSPEFEDCWQYISNRTTDDCHLEGTNQTIQELLSPKWKIHSCSRCQMPVPMIDRGLPPTHCPCFDLSIWPNLNLPLPHAPVDSQQHLSRLQNRLKDIASTDETESI